MPVRPCSPAFTGSDGGVSWRGVLIDADALDDLRAGPLRERAVDEAFELAVADELRALDSTDMATDVLADFLYQDPAPLDWQVGEALAETLLEEWHGALWIWNGSRDRKTAKASLPGADLVGFMINGEDVRFLFGEVKSSCDAAAPPGVVYGRSGLIHQLENLCAAKDHWTLIKWLRSRCIEEGHLENYRVASKRYLSSRMKDLRLVGCLVRDTPVDEADVKARAVALATKVAAPTKVELHVWYLPLSMADWPDLVAA